jgi:short-subunit dehydrogenase
MRVFLTGASSGIGEALARFYAGRGDTLGLLARREDHLARLKGELGVPVETYAADVTDLQAVKAAAAAFIAKHGLPDIVIGNAGVSHGTLTEFEDDVAVFRQIMDVNVNGVVNTFHPFIAPMKARGSGSLVGIASVAGFRGLPGASAYSASKAATISYCEALRVELRRPGVQVTTICPGYIATPMTAGNPYPMPFIIPADEFARRCARAIDAKASLAVIPWQMAIVGRIFRMVPNFLYDRMMAKAGRKPRKNAAG